MTRGRFIAFEGIDGAGTTTQQARCLTALAGLGIKATGTREPSDGPVGTMIRQMLRGRIAAPRSLRDAAPEVDPRVLALLFAGDRLDHWDEEIDPILSKGIWVVSDRYVDSSRAYQSIYMDGDWIREINRHAPLPDLTIFLEVPPKVAMARIEATRVSTDHFETLARLERVHENYLKILESREDLLWIDGTREKQVIHEQIMEHLKKGL